MGRTGLRKQIKFVFTFGSAWALIWLSGLFLLFFYDIITKGKAILVEPNLIILYFEIAMLTLIASVSAITMILSLKDLMENK